MLRRMSDQAVLSIDQLDYLTSLLLPGVYQVVKHTEIYEHYTYAKSEPLPRPDYTKTVTFQYGDYGNLKLQSTVSKYSDGTVNSLYTFLQYWNDPAINRLGYVCQKTICADEKLEVVLEKVNYTYYAATMALHVKSVWVKEQPNAPLVETRHYDSFGNVKRVVDTSGAEKHYTYDETTFFTYPSVITYPKNEQGEALQETFTYDLSFA